jgi:hypothetical protein
VVGTAIVTPVVVLVQQCLALAAARLRRAAWRASLQVAKRGRAYAVGGGAVSNHAPMPLNNAAKNKSHNAQRVRVRSGVWEIRQESFDSVGTILFPVASLSPDDVLAENALGVEMH